jgi:hypothetical protein
LDAPRQADHRAAPSPPLSPEIRWALLRAFGPLEHPFPEPLDPERALATAGDLGLVERIGARVPASLLLAELGRDAARRLALARLQTLAPVHGLCGLLPELASIAASASIPFVLLKFAALHAGGYLAEGSRAAGDVDVLVREGDAGRAAAALRAGGFFSTEAALADHHHLPPLHDRRGRVVELHTRLPGLREPGARRFAGLEALERRGALGPAPGLGPACRLPNPEVLLAHAVAHGFAQHGGADPYPLTRMLADVIDVRRAGHAAAGAAAAAWISADVPAPDLAAILALCEVLERGHLDALSGRPAELLRHVLAGALDPDYRRALALGQAWRAPSDEPRWRRLVKTVQALAWPTKAQLAARLGLPSARQVDRRLRLAHARGLARRLPGLARAALSLAWRRVSRRSARDAAR